MENSKLKCLVLKYAGNLHFLSYRVLKMGDYVYSTSDDWLDIKNGITLVGNEIFVNNQQNYRMNYSEIFKVEATTDKDLSKSGNLPLIPESFVKKFYNSTHKIEFVMIDMTDSSVKVRNDGTVIVSKAKDSWTREEVIEIADKLLRTYRLDHLPHGEYPDYTINETMRKFKDSL